MSRSHERLSMECIVAGVAARLHNPRLGRMEAAGYYADCLELGPPRDEDDALKALGALLTWCLDRGRKDLAAQLLWSPAQFTPSPESVSRIWRGVDQHAFTLLMGASSMGKTYTVGVLFFLEWLRDPRYTVVRAIGPTEEHLQSNLFSHLVEMHRTAAIPLPGKAQDLFIGLDPRNKRGGILGTVLPQGKKSAGRLQGGKRVPRPEPHPVLGDMSRLFVLVDEIENVPQGLYADMENLVSNLMGPEDRGFKVVGAFNPKDATKPPYRMAEPKKGWKAFDLENDYEWDSKAGYHVIRLDAERSENVRSGKVIFPGLQTLAGLERLAEVSFGKTSPGYMTFGRGAYPILGEAKSLISEPSLNVRIGEPIWLKGFWRAGGCDLALEGGDSVRYAHGRYGIATGVKLANGETLRFEDADGRVEPRMVAVLDGIRNLPKGDTTRNAREIRAASAELQIEPERLCLDRTGVGAGTHDVLRSFWSPLVQGVNYTEGATERKVFENDPTTPKEEYVRVLSELWFAFRRLLEHGCLWFAPSFMESPAQPLLWEQLCGRLYDPNRSNRVESKSEYKARGNNSPDEADGATLFIHAVRAALGSPFRIGRSASAEEGEDYAGVGRAVGAMDPVPAFTDVTNRIDYLED